MMSSRHGRRYAPVFIAILGAILLCRLGSGQATKLSVTASNTQAIITYTAPTDAACTVQAYDLNYAIKVRTATWASNTITVTTTLQHLLTTSDMVWVDGTGVAAWDGKPYAVASVISGTQFTIANTTSGSATQGRIGVLVHDVNANLYGSSATSDKARFPELNKTRQRAFVIGKRRTQLALNNKRYSRALQAASDHALGVTCAGTPLYSLFQTDTIALGNATGADFGRSDPDIPGQPDIADFDLRSQEYRPDGVCVERVIEPQSGMLYTNSQCAGERSSVQDISTEVSSAWLRQSTGWTNPNNIRSGSGGVASYSGTTQDVICVTPKNLGPQVASVDNLPTYGVDGTSVDSVQVVLQQASSTGTAGLEVALSFNGCGSRGTNWLPVSLTGTPSTYNVPTIPGGKNAPKAAFEEWINVGDRVPTRVDVLTLRNDTFVTDGVTAQVSLPDNTGSSDGNNGFYAGYFHETLTNGSFIHISPTTWACDDGTNHTITAFINPKLVTTATIPVAGTNLSSCIPKLSFMFRKSSTNADTVSLRFTANVYWSTAPVPDSGGGRHRNSPKPVNDGDGNRGYLMQKTDNGLYWISAENGEGRRVGSQSYPGRMGVWNAPAACIAAGNTFLPTAPTTSVCAFTSPIDGHSVPVKVNHLWSGTGAWKAQPAAQANSWVECISNCSGVGTPNPNPSVVLTPLIDGSGHQLSDLVADFNPAFVPAKFPNCSLGDVKGTKMAWQCAAGGQDSIGWVGTFDLTRDIANYVPGNAATNPVIGAIGPGTVGVMYSVIHSATIISDTQTSLNLKPGRQGETPFTGDGPFVMDLATNALNNTTDVVACPPNSRNYTQCSAIVVTSEPFDPDPVAPSTGAPGEYGNYPLDGVLAVENCWTYKPQEGSCTNAEAASHQEKVRVLSKSGAAPNITLVVARAIAGSPLRNWPTTLNCPVASITAGSPGGVSCTVPHGFVTGMRLVMGCSSCGVSGASGAFSITVTSATAFTLDGSTVAGVYTTGGSVSSLPRLRADHIAEGDTNPPDSPIIWDHTDAPIGIPTGHICTNPLDMSHYACNSLFCMGAASDGIKAFFPMSAAVNCGTTPFASAEKYGHKQYKIGMVQENTVEQYWACNHEDFDINDPRKKFCLNSRPVALNTPGPGEGATFQKIGGTSYVYVMRRHEDPDTFWPLWNLKVQEFAAYVGYRPLLDVSGPTSALTDTSADWWKICYARVAGECWAGSKAFEKYIVAPYVNKISSGSNYRCRAIGSKDMNDICVNPFGIFTDMGVQYFWGMRNNMALGAHFRKLGPGWSHGKAGGYGQVPKIFSDGNWMGPLISIFGTNRVRTPAWYAKLPPPPAADHINRLFFVPQEFSISKLPPGATLARIRFGYDEWSDLATDKYYCTTRRDNCLAAASSLIRPYEPADGLNPAARQYGQVNLVSDTYVVTAVNPVTVSFPAKHRFGSDTKISAQSCGDVEITIISQTSISLNGTTTCRGIGDAPYIGWWRSDSPFLYASENTTIDTTANNGGLIEVFTTTEHHMQTGNRICITGNAAANGCWAITYTGPAAFTLQGSTAAGVVTGGTVTPGGVPAVGGVWKVVVPALTQRVLFAEWEFLNASGVVVARQRIQPRITP